jgi:hypothetical protein
MRPEPDGPTETERIVADIAALSPDGPGPPLGLNTLRAFYNETIL